MSVVDDSASPTLPDPALESLASVPAPTTQSLTRVDRYRRRYRLLVGALLLIAFVVYLAGNNLFPLVDRDEPRYAEASREMLASGNWVVPSFLGEPRLKKPPLIYWAQATSMRVFGDTASAARLPSVLATVATLALLAGVFPLMVGRRRALWATFIFGTALMPAYLAKVCMTDAVLHLFVAAAMLGLYAVWRGTARWPTYLMLGVAIGLSVLTKGPPAFLFMGMTLLALWALNQTIDDAPPGKMITLDVEQAVPYVFARLIVVMGIALAICLPWVIAFEHRVPGGLVSMFNKEVVERGADAQEQHGGPPGYYAFSFWACYFPWCLFWPAALVHGWKRRRLPWVRFSLAAVVGPWLFLELYRTKLPHYWLPSYPFMALLTADVLIRGMRARIVDFRERNFLWGATAFAVFCALAGVAVLVVPWFGQHPFPIGAFIGRYIAAIVLAVAFGLLGWGTLTLIKRRELDRAALVMGLGTWALLAFVTTIYWPTTTAMTLSQRVGLSLRDLQATRPGDAQMVGFKEPGTAFYQGGTITEQRDRSFLHQPSTQPLPRYLVADQKQLDTAMTPTDLARWPIVRSFTGLNVAQGMIRQRIYILENHMPLMLPSDTTRP